jgi:prevent-host-death family protein
MPRIKQYSIAEARSSLAMIVDQAESGWDVQLTRRGKPVAVLVSLQKFERLQGDRTRFSVAYKDFLSRHSPQDVGLDEDFVETIRDQSVGREDSL